MTLTSFRLSDQFRVGITGLSESGIALVRPVLGAPLAEAKGTEHSLKIVITKAEPSEQEARELFALDSAASLIPFGVGEQAAKTLLYFGERQTLALAREQNLPAILTALLPAAVLVAGGIAVHGTTLSMPDEAGVLLLGQAHCGKPGAMLMSVDDGGCFIADDLVVLDEPAAAAAASPAEVSIALEYLAAFPWLAETASSKSIGSARRRQRFESVCRTLLPPGFAARLLPGRLSRRWISGTRSRIRFTAAPESIYSRSPRGAGLEKPTPLQHWVSIVVAPGSAPGWKRSDARELVTRWRLSLEPELAAVKSAINDYRYRYPRADCLCLDQLVDRASQRLVAAVEGKRIGAIHLAQSHPTPDLLYGLVKQLVTEQSQITAERRND